jgi:hypothetical protein
MRSTPLMRKGENLKSKIFAGTLAEDEMSLEAMLTHGYIVAGEGEEKKSNIIEPEFYSGRC